MLNCSLCGSPVPDDEMGRRLGVCPQCYRDVQTREEQAYFWTSAWQARERETDEDLCLGRYKEGTLGEILADLHSPEEVK